jgi:hypothetical protein
MDYGKIFTRSWEVFWKHKILWVFGMIGGISAIFNNLMNYFRYDLNVDDWTELESTYSLYREPYREIIEYAYENMALFIVFLILGILALLTVSYLIYAYGIAGLTQGNLLAERSSESMTFREIHEAIRPYFWRVFGLNLLLGVSGMGIVFLLMMVLMILAIVTLGIGMLCFMPLMCLLVPVMWFIGIVVIQALIALVAEDLSIKDSLVRAWKLVTGNFGPYLLVWLLVVIVSLVVGFVISLPSMAPVFSMWSTMMSPEVLDDPNTLLGKISDMVKWGLIWTPFIVVLRGILTAFTQSVWVQTYLEVREDGTLETSDQPETDDPELESMEQTN